MDVLRERLRHVLLAGREASEEEALLLGLLEPLGLIDSLVARGQRRAARKRAKAVAEQGVAGNAVRDAIHAVQAEAAVVALTWLLIDSSPGGLSKSYRLLFLEPVAVQIFTQDCASAPERGFSRPVRRR